MIKLDLFNGSGGSSFILIFISHFPLASDLSSDKTEKRRSQ